MDIYQAISNVAAELAAIGIGKTSRNQQQGFAFRGIDAVMNTLAPLLAKHRLVVLPRVLARQCVERVTGKGTALFYVVVEVEYDLVAAVDGSRHTVRVVGEAMDSGDKATNKAMSAAYKYAMFQTFCVPTEGTPDADAETHEVAALPDGFRDWMDDMEIVARQGGTTALLGAWKQSKTEYKALVQSAFAAEWHHIKELATQQDSHV
jgi:hypothetical protein